MAVVLFACFLGFGLVAGLGARRLMNGPDPAGIAGTVVIGLIAGLAVSLVGSLVLGVPVTAFDERSLLMAISGTLFALFCYRAFAMRWPDQIPSVQAAAQNKVRTTPVDALNSVAKRA
jgi:uncharacterized membrane protein YeaQ/YmgE (transglycosylase-associated protein family)